MLGISVYLDKDTKENIISYIDLAAKYGYKRLFTCLLSVDESKEKITQKYKNRTSNISRV